MKILIVTQYYWPENFQVNSLSTELLNRGHDIEVVTGNPNYPHGHFYTNYGFKFSIETYKGIKIYRVPIFSRGKSIFRLLLNYLSFVISGSIFLFFHKEKYDKIFAVNYSPISSVIPAIIFKIKNDVKLLLWVQDLWPESVTATLGKNNILIEKVLNPLVKLIYNKCDKILISNKGFKEAIISKGVRADKISFLPNWADDFYEKKEFIKINKYKNIVPDGFVVLFAGNIGEAQDFENIIKAIEITKHISEIKWVFIGDGRKKEWLICEIKNKKLNHVAFVLRSYPPEEMPSFFIHASVTLVSLKDEYIFSLTTPNKVQSYLAASKPILTMLNGEGSKIIDEAKCGLIANASDYNTLANNVIEAFKYPEKKLLNLGKNGNKLYNKYYKKSICIDNLSELLNKT